MIKIGDFSKLGKTTIKTLRYYEKEGLLFPKFIDLNGYRYYETEQLIDLAKIMSYRQIGLSIKKIKELFSGANNENILKERLNELKSLIVNYEYEITQINYLLEEKNMNYEVIIKNIPECNVYYMEGVIADYSKIGEFILKSAEECLKINPGIKCVSPDYCYVNYLDKEYRKKNVSVRYAQAVETKGVENDLIKFMTLPSTEVLCIYHKGSYSNLGHAYAFIMDYIKKNNLEIIDIPRESYIDGVWNKECEDDYLTEIQVPIKYTKKA